MPLLEDDTLIVGGTSVQIGWSPRSRNGDSRPRCASWGLDKGLGLCVATSALGPGILAILSKWVSAWSDPFVELPRVDAAPALRTEGLVKAATPTVPPNRNSNEEVHCKPGSFRSIARPRIRFLPKAQAAGPPNVLLIVTDDQRTNGTLSTMPEVRKLRSEGADFRRTYATTPFLLPVPRVHHHGPLHPQPRGPHRQADLCPVRLREQPERVPGLRRRRLSDRALRQVPERLA